MESPPPSHDLTPRTRDREPRPSDEGYRAIFDASNDAMFIHDLETGAILDANRRACEYSGVTLEQVQRDALSIIANGPPPFTADRASAFIQRAARGEPVRFEWMSHFPGSRDELWTEVSLQRVEINGTDRRLAIARDIRERKAAERAIQASEERYRLIFRHSSDAIWLHDVETGKFLEVNDAVCEMSGHSVEETKAIGVQGLSAGIAPYTIAEGQTFIQRAAAGQPQRFEWLGRHRDGSDVWGEVQLRRVTIAGVDRILATARDIGARKAAGRHDRARARRWYDAACGAVAACGGCAPCRAGGRAGAPLRRRRTGHPRAGTPAGGGRTRPAKPVGRRRDVCEDGQHAETNRKQRTW